VVLYEVRDWRKTHKVTAWNAGHHGTMWALRFAPESRTLVTTASDGRIKFWNVATRETALTLVHGDGPGGHVAFSRDGNLMASSDGHGILKLWPAAPADETRRAVSRKQGADAK
jgi:WD40 repeat protein